MERMWEHVPSGLLTVTIREGYKVQSFPSLCPLERPRYGNFALVATPTLAEEQGEGKEHAYTFPTGPMPAYARHNAERPLSYLPVASIQKRRLAEKEEFDAMEARRRAGYASLSLDNKRFEDGLLLVHLREREGRSCSSASGWFR